MSKQPRLVVLIIESFSKDGHGLTTWVDPQGKSHAVEVPFAVPEDEVLVQLFKKRKGIFQSRVIEWIRLAGIRIAPRCKHFGACGGCRWQHLDYALQLQLKEKWIQRCLKTIPQVDVIWHPIIPCPSAWHYRNKMELTFSMNKARHPYLGLILYGTRGHVFQMEECHIDQPWMIQAVNAVTEWWKKSTLEAYHAGRNSGSLRTLTLRDGMRSGDRLVMLTVSGEPQYALNKKNLDDFVQELRQTIEPHEKSQNLSIFLRIQQVAKGKQTQFYEMLLYGPDHIQEILNIEFNRKAYALKFQISPTAFFQPNTQQAEKIYSEALRLAQPSSDATVFDLYCGTGTLGICFAKYVREVIGIDLSPESTLDARENVKLNQLTNVTIYTGDVGQTLPRVLEQTSKNPECVVVDPPRSGLDAKAIHQLLKIKAPKLIYISCNPATQADNLQSLIEGGYRLRAVQPVDQFPQTVHVENIALLIME